MKTFLRALVASLLFISTHSVIAQPLSGHYTISGANLPNNFYDLPSLLSRLHTWGVNGPVVIDLLGASFNQQQYTFASIPGTSPVNTVTFRGVCGDARFSYNSTSPDTNFTVKLSGLKYVTFEHISFTAIATTNSPSTFPPYFCTAVLINDNNDYITFRNCSFYTIAWYDSTFFTAQATVKYTNAGNNHMVFDSCQLINGCDGISGRGVDSIVVKNSTFTNQLRYGVEADSANLLLLNNKFTGCELCVQAGPVGDRTRIDGNSIHCTKCTYGLTLGVRRIGSDTARRIQVCNNMIMLDDSTLNSPTCTGLYLYTSYVDVTHNSIYNRHRALPSGDLYCFYASPSSRSIRVLNNVFLSMGGSVSMWFQGGIPLVSDYNVFYNSLPGGMVANTGAGSGTLAQYQAQSGLDLHSRSFMPYYSYYRQSLLTCDTALAFGIPWAPVPTDIHGQRRGTPTGVGVTDPYAAPAFTLGVDIPYCDHPIPLRPSSYYGSGYGYTWSTGARTTSIIADTTGTYTVTATNGCGLASASDTIHVNIVPGPLLYLGPDTVACHSGAVVAIDASTHGLADLSAYAFSWVPCIPRPVNYITYTGRYIAQATLNTCVISDTIRVTIQSPAPVTITPSTAVACLGDSVTLRARGARSYAWSPSVLFGSTDSVQEILPAAPIMIIALGTDSLGCHRADTVTLRVSPRPVAHAGTMDSVCPGATFRLGGSPPATGGVAPYTYLWQGPGITGVSSAHPVDSITVPALFILQVADSYQCRGTDSLRLRIMSLPALRATPDTALCAGASITLAATGAATYLWSGGQATAAVSVSPPASASYLVHGYGINGCATVDTVHVTVHQLPAVSAGAAQGICDGQRAVLTATGALVYAWSTGGDSAAIHISPLSTAVYYVTGTDICGCTRSDSVRVTVTPYPIVYAGRDTSVCRGSALSLSASGTGTLTWSTGSHAATVQVSPAASTAYNVQATTSGCSSYDTVQVTVLSVPVAAIAGTTAGCVDDTLHLTGSGAGQLLWSGGDTSSSHVVALQHDAQVWLRAVDASGCAGYDTVAIIAHPLPVAMISGPASGCRGASIQLTGSGGQQYSWSTGAQTAAITMTLDRDTIITLTVTSAGGCTGTASQAISVQVCTGITEPGQDMASIYPNPVVHGSFELAVDPGWLGGAFYLVDASGRIIMHQEIQAVTSAFHLSLPSGIYLYRITDRHAGKTTSGKITVID